ncbi:CaiB/BaiF CoA-transferase family protein [Bordetella sp. BOR01]|uniref:CaiB/BaiF CoA transferase family protein n=1 Tax=Bordetella sp. BOR01 TaxID=2854779 RepID=UPI001C4796A9|nr:CaiB/BaiF CoA-transferase family protein [Bordetella sp. BOR01]MBV7484872.1 CoA transferase [Bordetella sp. BOR01]
MTETARPFSGPLAGIKVVELAGLGPAPMAAMLLADLGATVIRVDRRQPADLGIRRPRKYDLLLRNRDLLGVDLKDPASVALVLELIGQADALIEGFRPGVMERLGLGPDTCLQRNPRLVYGRVTGWGQSGPLAQAAGHDLNYVALTGAINAMGSAGQPPTVPLSMIGDFGGGALYLAFGMLAALIEARSSGQGQVVDAAMVDGVISLQTIFLGMHAAGIWDSRRGHNPIDSGSHFYNVYECADHKWISVAALEKRFHDELMQRIGIDLAEIGDHMDPRNWPKGKTLLADRFRQRTRDEWCELLEGSDACFAPVLSWDEAVQHPHLHERGSFCQVDDVWQPATAPRFSRTPAGLPTPPRDMSSDNNAAALAKWLPPERIKALRAAGTIA